MSDVLSSSDVIRGRCLCGAVRLALVPPTVFVSHCHCESCRRAHAAAFVTWTAVSEAAFTVERGVDALTAYGSSPGVTRSFCGRCGTQLIYRMEGLDRVYVPVAVLEGIDQLPDSHVSYEERVAWLAGVETLPCFVGKSETERLAWGRRE